MEDRDVKRLKRHVVRLRVRLAGLSAGARFAAGAFAAVILGGAVWLVWAMVSPEPMIAVARDLDGVSRERAAVALVRQGVKVRRTEGGLLVPAGSLPEAQKVLRSTAPSVESSGFGLRKLADSSSMWRSSAENKRIWQAGVTAELGRLITDLAPIESASVLFEPGSPGGLGSQGRAARAAVKVTLVKGRRMAPGLVVAIGELVSGSVSVELGEVRVIDQTGRSYRPSSDVLTLARRNSAESYYTEKVTSALRYIPGVTADVQIIGARVDLNQLAGDGLRVWISVPRSYVSSSGNTGSQQQQIASIKNAAHAILGPAGRHEVTVALHGPVGAKVNAAQAAGGIEQSVFFIAIVASAFLGGMGLWLALRYRRIAVGRPVSIPSPVRDQSNDELGYDLLASLPQEPSEEPDDEFAGEHPQTLALILSRMPTGQARDIISRLPLELRSEVTRRMDDLSDVDAEVVSEINRDISRRVGRSDGEAENPDRRRAERDALKLLAFEDIVHLGSGELRIALGAVDSDDLAISLRMAARHVKRKVLGCLVAKDAQYVRSRMDGIGPVRICDVESARQRVMEIVSQASGVSQAPKNIDCGEMMEGAV
jgi:hypothetical protein